MMKMENCRCEGVGKGRNQFGQAEQKAFFIDRIFALDFWLGFKELRILGSVYGGG